MRRVEVTTYAIEWTNGHAGLASGLLAQARGLEVLAKLTTRAALALVPALALLGAASWAAGDPGTQLYLQVVLWASGFVFFALAVEAERPGIAGVKLGIGITVQLLTWLSARLAPELALVAAAVVAAWATVALFRRS
jgi:hypothetical protein